MKRFRVRRLPVIDVNGALKGVMSINDIVLATERGAGPDAKEIVSTLAAIYAHRAFTPGMPAVA